MDENHCNSSAFLTIFGRKVRPFVSQAGGGTWLFSGNAVLAVELQVLILGGHNLKVQILFYDWLGFSKHFISTMQRRFFSTVHGIQIGPALKLNDQSDNTFLCMCIQYLSHSRRCMYTCCVFPISKHTATVFNQKK